MGAAAAPWPAAPVHSVKTGDLAPEAARRTSAYLLLLTCTAAVLALSLSSGSVTVSASELWSCLTQQSNGMACEVILRLRLPRALTAFAAGGLLALAGALMQVLLRNPLADPFVMGVSGGAAAMALTALSLGLGALAVDLAATGGALLTTALVFLLARGDGGWVPTRLLLTGVVVAAGTGALVSTLLILSDETQMRGMLFWLMGDLSLSGSGAPLLLLLSLATLLMYPFARHLNLLARGDLQAQLLGAPVRALRIGIFVGSSALTAVAVTAVGTIGFIGLVTPHMVRLVFGSDHRVTLPATALLGGTLLMSADLCARTWFAPRQLPVGALTALVGVPVFLILMKRNQLTNATK
jgi:iron complex transport system permease protein